MIAGFFIDRPRFAIVISILILIGGFISLRAIPVAQLPDIVPPTVRVTATYPGASAAVIQDAIAAPIEAEVNGVDDMLYMSSTSTNSGRYQLRVTFAAGTNPDIAAVNVQNRVNVALPFLPAETRNQGIRVEAVSPALVQIATLTSPEGTFDELFMSNYAKLNILDRLKRIEGVGDAQLYAQFDYSMRIWFRTDALAALALTPADIAEAIRSQNQQAAVGQIGAQPAPDDQSLQLTLQTQGRLVEAREFEDIILRVEPDGSLVRIRDVARVELGSAIVAGRAFFDGGPSMPIGIYLAPGANQVATAERVKDAFAEMGHNFPDDLDYEIFYDTTEFVEETIEKVQHTLYEAFVLVAIVVFVFLGSVRSTAIPIIAVPITLIGVFIFLNGFGFSANTISLLAVVLAIGIVVDDAIVVVENVERVLHENPDWSVNKATKQAMSELTGPLIATPMVLLSVFLPTMFIPGVTGTLFSQFAVVIIFGVLLSAVNAQTLTPALCAMFLKADHGTPPAPIRIMLKGVDAIRDGYAAIANRLLPFANAALVVILVVGVFTAWMFRITPTGFLPAEDQGAFMGEIQLPSGASLNRTIDVARQVEQILAEDPAVEHYLLVPGFSILDRAPRSHSAMVVVRLKSFEERRDPALSVFETIPRLTAQAQSISTANTFFFNLPPIIGFGTGSGFEYQLQNAGARGHGEFAAVSRGMLGAANAHPNIARAFTTWSADTPQVYLHIDRERAETLGVPVSRIFSTLQASLGGAYINDFTYLGRSWQVRIMGDADDRNELEDIDRINVRANDGSMIALRSLVEPEFIVGPDLILRFNNVQTLKIQGGPAPGASSGEAIAAMEALSEETLPDGYTYEWTGTAVQEKESAGQSTIILALAGLFAYLVLVALYESWTMPLAIMLSIVIGIAGAVLTLNLLGLPLDIYAQIGIVTLIALAAKNGILIIEFAIAERNAGKSIIEAAANAGRLRIRAVLMTSFAFIAGLIPLVTAVGAGALTQRAVGSGVQGGMIFASTIGVFLIPMLYVVLQTMREWVRQRTARTSAAE